MSETLRPGPSVRVRVRQLAHAGGLELPAYETPGAAGLDLRAALERPVQLAPGGRLRVPTGLVVEIPAGYELQIRPRSGLAARTGVTLANSPATIDSDYRGEVVVALAHLGEEPLVIERGMRIAQLVLAAAPRLVWEPAETLSETGRGAGGFGHTGLE
ncbi:MAG TPA: dUTP diphosphatase [Candidatus Acidoferrales bacterium]|nr:dUTP diphosphatase [Candidatus Acidoferrales bacterium]